MFNTIVNLLIVGGLIKLGLPDFIAWPLGVFIGVCFINNNEKTDQKPILTIIPESSESLAKRASEVELKQIAKRPEFKGYKESDIKYMGIKS